MRDAYFVRPAYSERYISHKTQRFALLLIGGVLQIRRPVCAKARARLHTATRDQPALGLKNKLGRLGLDPIASLTGATRDPSVTRAVLCPSLHCFSPANSLNFTAPVLLLPTMAQLALTTTFTPPASCFDTSTILDVWTTVCAAGLASCQYQVLGQAPDGSKTCMPPGYTPGGNNYYSPGICPSGYATACSSLNSVGSLTETVATCCPT